MKRNFDMLPDENSETRGNFRKNEIIEKNIQAKTSIWHTVMRK